MKASLSNIRFVFLDRDGVINRKPPEGAYISQWSDFHLLPGVESAIAALNHRGVRVIVISNQRGVALGYYTAAAVDALHAILQEHLAANAAHIDGFYYCPHDRNECNCRKPGTGLFERAFQAFPEASSLNSVVIGDSLSDIEAARKLGFPSIFIHGDPDTQKPGATEAAARADLTSDSLAAAIEQIVG